MRIKRGFTSMELLVSMAIVAVLVLLVLPAYFDYVQKTRLKLAAETLYHELGKMRVLAVKEQSNKTIEFLTGANWCYGATANTSCSCNTANSCELGGGQSDDNGVSMSLTGISDSTIFEGVRGTLSVPGSITFTSGADGVTLVLTKLGTVRLCSNSIGEYGAC